MKGYTESDYWNDIRMASDRRLQDEARRAASIRASIWSEMPDHQRERQLNLPCVPSPVDVEPDRSIARARKGVGEAWIKSVVEYIGGWPDGRRFTTDDLWRALPQPPEPRAMGAAIRAAQKLGLIKHAGTWQESKRAACHRRPVSVWERTVA